MVLAEAEHARFYRRVAVNPGLEDSASFDGWTSNGTAPVVVGAGEDPSIALNWNRPWTRPWPRLDSGEAQYLAAAGKSQYAFGAWSFSTYKVEPTGLEIEPGRHYSGSVRLYVAPGDSGITLRVLRLLCQADVDAGGTELAVIEYSPDLEYEEPWPIGEWRRIEIPSVLCDVSGLPGIRFQWTGPASPNVAGAAGIDNLVLHDTSPGPRRAAL